MSNGLAFPYTVFQNSSSVRHYQKLRKVPTDGGAVYSNIELTYANFVAMTGNELTNYQPITLQAEILYNGAYYPVTFNNQRSVVVNGGGYVTGKVAGLSLPSGAQFYERVRIVGAFAGAQNYLASHGARRALLEGAIAGTNTDVNFLGGKEGHGATCSFVIQSGRITSASLTAAGMNYTGPGIVAAFEGAKQIDDTVGYTDESGGRMSSITITDRGEGYSANTKCVVTGGGGFGINTSIFAASMITGVPSVEGLEAILIVGDSIARGYGSTDATGDGLGNYGIFERAVGNRHATATTALPGNAATAYKNPTAHKRMHAIVLPYMTHALINFGTNDIAAGTSAASVASANAQTADELRKAGLKVSFATLIPRVSGSYTTLGGQTPVAGFAANAAADTYNNWVRAGTNGVKSDWGVIDARNVYKDSASQNKWRVDSIMTSDGIHPNLAVGVPFGAAQLAERFKDLIPTSGGGDHTSTTTINSYANNTTINLAPTVNTVALHGKDVIVNGGAANYTLSSAGGNTVNAGSGEATLTLAGVYDKINVGAGNTFIEDQGTYNVIRLAEAGGGIAVINGKIFGHGTRLDLRGLLASTSWRGDSPSISQYLKVWISGATATLLVSPTGPGGANYVAAQLTSYDSLALSTLLDYSMY